MAINRRQFLKITALSAAATVVACSPVPPAAPSGGEMVESPTQAPSDGDAGTINLTLWTFVNTHARWFRSMAEDYRKEKPEFSLDVVEISDMFDKLKLALLSGGEGAPDLADIEQGAFGQFLRGKQEPDLVDLTSYLNTGDYMNKLVASREALYSYRGKVYGVEHALCPVVIYYRSDVFEDAGIDMTKIATWNEWISAVQAVVHDDVVAIDFPSHEVMLRQNGGDYFDKDGQVALDSQISIDTMQWILDLQNKHKITKESPSGESYWAAFKEGKFLASVGADWYGGFFKDLAPDLSGKMKAAFLPRFTPNGARTSCWGGTGSCIVKFSKHIEDAWKFMEYSMLSVEGNVRRFQETTLFPPFLPAMDDQRLHKSDEYFSGQDMGALFAEIASEVPAQYQSPYRSELDSKLSGLWQDIYDLQATPEATFKSVANEIRQVMVDEGAA